MKAGKLDDLYFGTNTLQAQKLEDVHVWYFTRLQIEKENQYLRFEGIDTFADIYINGKLMKTTDNMFLPYEVEADWIIGENEVVVHIKPTMLETRKFTPPAVSHAMKYNAPSLYVRKAAHMFGWDIMPRIISAGLWKAVTLCERKPDKIEEVYLVTNKIEARESGSKLAAMRCFIHASLSGAFATDYQVRIEGVCGESSFAVEQTLWHNTAAVYFDIQQCKLWWPNGLGEQPLYTITAECAGWKEEKRIGLRTLKLVRERDKYGESFCHEVNGVRFFAMGADYIPEDNIHSRATPEKTYKLIRQCRDANFNAIRVWGGGVYPRDAFFDACDEMGIVVFEDMMVACVILSTTEEMKANFKAELYDNLRRIRHHASLALISGNNEVEEMFINWLEKYPHIVESYLAIYEDMVPELVKELCPYIPYVPSSPSSCGHFVDPRNENYGDSRYWEVWHGGKPFTDYRNKFFRYLSEFGFQSFPSEKTINAVTAEEDRNIFSRVMEMHQRNGVANGKILDYLSQTYKYPKEFGTLLYASQLLQAEAMRYGVEHLRRHRGRCMGTLYWQLNDIWTTASWSSIDYYGRLKALHYVAKRFYSPIMISCKETGEGTTRYFPTLDPRIEYETKAQLCVTNETRGDVTGEAVWALRDNTGKILQEGKTAVTVPALSSVWLEEMDFCKTDVDNTYMSFAFVMNGEAVSEGTVLFTLPKYFRFQDPKLRCEIRGDEITVYADAYAQYVEIDSPDSDFVLSDNYFDMNAGTKTVKILEGTPKTIRLRCVYDIQ